MRATLTTVAVSALLAAGAGTASARTDTPSGRADAARHAAGMRTQIHHAVRGAAAQSLRAEQRAAVGASRQSVPAPSVHVTRVADDGIDWADVGIGASLAAALLLAGAGVVRRQHIPAAH